MIKWAFDTCEMKWKKNEIFFLHFFSYSQL